MPGGQAAHDTGDVVRAWSEPDVPNCSCLGVLCTEPCATPNAIPPSASLIPPPLPPPHPIPSHHHHPAPATEQVVEDKGETQQAGRMGDLLGQFNVATFKTSELSGPPGGPDRAASPQLSRGPFPSIEQHGSLSPHLSPPPMLPPHPADACPRLFRSAPAADEDDTAFWNRLIPEDQRPKEKAEVVSCAKPCAGQTWGACRSSASSQEGMLCLGPVQLFPSAAAGADACAPSCMSSTAARHLTMPA